MGAHGAIRWPARSPDLNPLDFFIFIRNFRDNVYLTPPGTQKELRKKIVRVCQEQPRNFLLNAKVGISRRYRHNRNIMYYYKRREDAQSTQTD
jgi:hypothetical protein